MRLAPSGSADALSLRAPRHWPTIAEAAVALAAVALLTRLLTFERYIGLGSRRRGARDAGDARTAARIVDALAERSPFRAVCLQRGLAVQWMLRRRGAEAVLRYGVRLTPGEGPSAHVWVSVGEEVVSGAPQHLEYTEVARYPRP